LLRQAGRCRLLFRSFSRSSFFRPSGLTPQTVALVHRFILEVLVEL
jgi:hypothetical protein